jgi:outer membrane receptor for ferrienterochelin and colicin
MLAFVIALLFTSAPARQTSSLVVTGRVTAGAPATAVVGAVVRSGQVSVVTDADGRFSLTPAALATASSITLTVTARGFLDETVTVPVAPGRGPVVVTLTANPEYREQVEVSARSASTIVEPPSVVLGAAEVRSVAGAVDNVFRVLQTLPGVSATDDFGSRLSVRGGGPDQNLTVMDGVEIHNPYRLFGLTSAFNPETIDRFELTAGGFGAKYGDRLSSLLVIDNRAGTTSDALAGSATLSATDGNLVLEGRMPRGSWLVTGRRTYYDVFAERVTDNDLPSFTDLQAKAAWQLGSGRRLSLFALRSRENTDAQFESDVAGDRLALLNLSSNDVGSLMFSAPLGTRATTHTVVSWYRYADVLDVDGSFINDTTASNEINSNSLRSNIVFRRTVGVRDLSFRQELAYSPTPRQTLTAGIEAHALRTDWNWVITGDRNDQAANGSAVIGGAGLPDLLDSSRSTTRAGAWIEDDVRLAARLRVAGGVRMDRSGISGETTVSPRLRATIDVSARSRIRFAAGRFTQSPGYEKLLQSDYFVDLSDSATAGLKSEQSLHGIAGLDHQFSASMTGRVEAYYKTFDKLIVGRLETAEETAARVARYAFPADLASSVPNAPQITTTPVNGASGRSYGFDAYLEKRARTANTRLSGWIAYTWGRATVDSYGRTYPLDYDRRHALSVVSMLRLSRRLDLGATLRVASGFPETLPTGVRVASVPAPGAVEGAPGSLIPAQTSPGKYIWTIDNGGVENLNQKRLPVFARLDLRLTYRPSPSSRWLFYFEAINALNRDNAGSLSASLLYDPTGDRPKLAFTPDGGLPLLPSFGLRVRF